MFSVAQYFDHIEEASAEIQRQTEPIDRTMILWWGVDGLKLDENGKLEWVSRKKKEPAVDPQIDWCRSSMNQNYASYMMQGIMNRQHEIEMLEMQTADSSHSQRERVLETIPISPFMPVPPLVQPPQIAYGACPFRSGRLGY